MSYHLNACLINIVFENIFCFSSSILLSVSDNAFLLSQLGNTKYFVVFCYLNCLSYYLVFHPGYCLTQSSDLFLCLIILETKTTLFFIVSRVSPEIKCSQSNDAVVVVVHQLQKYFLNIARNT